MKSTSSSQNRTLAAEVLVQLREDLLAGRFKPNQRLRMEDLKRCYAAGFTPLREALMHLASDGLVIIEQQRGFRVAPVSLTDLWDIADARQAIEEILLRDALTHGDDEWEAGIVSAFHRLSKVHYQDSETGGVSSEWARRHYAFHWALIDGAKSRWIKRFWQQLYEQSDRYRRVAVTFTKVDRESEHRKIMEAALDRNLLRIVELNTAHIKKTALIVAEHIPAALLGKSTN